MSRVLLLIFTLAFCAPSLSAQKYKRSIEKDFNKYLNLLEEKDFSSAMDFMVDDLFELVSKEELVQSMEEALNGPDMKFTILKSSIVSIGDSHEFVGRHFVEIRYKNEVSMEFRELKKMRTKKRDEFVAFMKEQFESNPTVTHCSYHEQSRTFLLSSDELSYAISEDGKSDWKFMTIDRTQEAFMRNIIPKVLADKVFGSESSDQSPPSDIPPPPPPSPKRKAIEEK